MRLKTLGVVAILAVAPACGAADVGLDDLSGATRTEFVSATDQYEMALIAADGGDTSLMAAAEARLTAATELAEAELLELEKVRIKDEGMGWFNVLGALPVVGPYVKGLEWLALPLVPALLGSRGRKHLKNVIKDVNPMSGRSGTEILSDLRKYFGGKHTEEGGST